MYHTFADNTYESVKSLRAWTCVNAYHRRLIDKKYKCSGKGMLRRACWSTLTAQMPLFLILERNERLKALSCRALQCTNSPTTCWEMSAGNRGPKSPFIVWSKHSLLPRFSKQRGHNGSIWQSAWLLKHSFINLCLSSYWCIESMFVQKLNNLCVVLRSAGFC